jgi:8-oxo-dGTP pyrophosphatase MutT (NUDIX family)
MAGGRPKPPSPAYQQYLYGVPRSDYIAMMRGTDIDDYGLTGAEVNTFRSDVMLYAPLWAPRESPYGFPPVERALLPIVSGLQKQEFQLDYFTEGTVPAVYISPGDPNITPTQIRELQDALNAIAGDPAYHMKVMVLPPGSKVEPQRPVDLSDTFDTLVMNQVCMAFDVQPTELGILPNVGGASPQGPSASSIRFAGQEARDIKTRKSTKPLMKIICDIFNYVLQDICNQPDMQFQFEGLVDDEDKQEITELGVQQVQNGIASIDEVRDRLDLAPWGLKETSEPVVFTAQGPIPFSMAPQLIMMAAQGQQQGSSSSSSSNSKGGKSQGTNSGQRTASSRSRTSQPSVRAGGQTKPNGSHPAPLSPHRESVTPGHAAAQGAVQSPTPRTGGTPSRSSVAGSRKKAVEAELDALKRHLRKGRQITTWEPRHITDRALGQIAEDMAKGVLIDVAVDHAAGMTDWDVWDDLTGQNVQTGWTSDTGSTSAEKSGSETIPHWPGWEQDLGLVGQYKEQISEAFHRAELGADSIRKDAVTQYSVTPLVLQGLISDQMKDVFTTTLSGLWATAWKLGYTSAGQLIGAHKAADPRDVEAFVATQGEHWAGEIARNGLGNNETRAEVIARTEVARAINAGAQACYAASGVSHKHLLVAPDDTCDMCLDAEEDGIIPLSASYSVKGGEPPFHPQCRCVSAPASVDAEPPLADLGKNCGYDDDNRVAWFLIRARDEDSKWRYLLQQRDDGSWGMPGGKCHHGENGFDAAYRETEEEIGDLPAMHVTANLTHTDPDGVESNLFLMECHTLFNPKLNGATPQETAGTGWFRRKEVALLNLTGKFRDDWDHIIRDAITKALAVNENGEVSDRPSYVEGPKPTGSNWPTPHRVDGTQENVSDSAGAWPDAGPGAVPDEHGSAGGEPPGWMSGNTSEQAGNWAVAVNTLYPPPSVNDGDMPNARGDAPRRGSPTPPGGAVTTPPQSSPQAGVSQPGGKTGVPPSGKGQGYKPGPTGTGITAPPRGDLRPGPGQSLSGGPVPAITPRPYAPHAYIPVQNAPDGNECSSCGGPYDAPWHEIRPARYPTVKGGASDYKDPNPVEHEHVLNQMRGNFPEDKLEWVKRARWTGPVDLPWDRVDTDDIDKWAASHQPQKVNDFAASMRKNPDSVKPSIAVQEPTSGKAFLVDGHHRALARKKLNQPVRAYLGNIDPEDRPAALETHTAQLHSGSSPQNKGETP